MKTLRPYLFCLGTILYLAGCVEGPRGPQGPTGPSGDDPTDPHIAPKVVWIWLDSPRPYGWRIDFQKQSDSLPIGYIPGRLLIRFNKIMVSYTVIPNVTLEPCESGFACLNKWGAFSIDGQTFEFPIFQPFKVAKSYTVKVGHDATDITNRKLEMDYEKVLVPEPTLRITSLYPSQNDTNFASYNSCSFYFNSSIDSNSIAGNVSISPNVSGKWVVENYYLSSLSFIPQDGFNAKTWYTITLSTGIKDTFNNYLPSQFTLKFRTAPFNVTYTYPYDGQQGIYLSSNIEVHFSNYIDTSTVRGAFTISPMINGTFNFSNFSFVFDPSQNFAANTNYTVTIATSLRSKLGDPLDSPYTFSFKTSP